MENLLKKRIYSFDLLKVISILIVFFHHIMMDMYIVHPMHNLSLLEFLIVRPNMNLGMIACGMFIFISGATLTLKEKEEEPITFYKRRLVRLLIPFYIAYIIYFAIRVINVGTYHIYGGVPKWRFIFTLLGMDEYLSANGIRTFSLGVGEWFLGCIILCYIVYPFLNKISKKYNIATFVILTIYYILININYDKFNFVIPSHMNFFCQIYNFYLGMIFMNFIKNGMFGTEEKLLKRKSLLLIILLIVIMFFYIYPIMLIFPGNFKTTIVVIALFIVFYLMESQISKVKLITDLIEFFNKISLEIFLVHHFVIYQADYILGYQRINKYKTLGIIFLDLIVTILLAIFVSRLSEKVTSLMYKASKK